jgi:outer membrane immunogenic protein
MNHSVVLGAVSAIALISSASAADLYRAPVGGSLKDPVYAPVDTWTGFYVGVNGGYGWSAGSSSVSAYADDEGEATDSKRKTFDAHGGFGGGQIGYNVQRNRLVYGVEVDLQGAGIDGSGTVQATAAGDDTIIKSTVTTASAKSNLDWFGTVRGRLGYAVAERTLVYFTGGLAFGGVQDSLTLGVHDDEENATPYNHTTKKNETRTGYVLGGGIEQALTHSISVKAEYQYLDLGSDRLSDQATLNNIPPSFGSGSATLDHTYHTVRVGVNYHIHDTYEPLK